MNIAHEYSRYSHSALENTPMSQVVHKRIRELPPPLPLVFPCYFLLSTIILPYLRVVIVVVMMWEPT